MNTNEDKNKAIEQTIQQVYSLLDFLKSQILSDQQDNKPCPTLAEYLDYYIKDYKENIVKPNTIRCMRIIIRHHLPSIFLAQKLHDITRHDCLGIINNTSSTRTQLDIFNLLNGVFKVACQEELLSKSPLATIPKPQHKQIKGKAISAENINKLLSTTDAHNRLFFKVALQTGARRSELCALEWRDINFEDNTIHIRGTKTKKSDRVIPLFDELAQTLEELRIYQIATYNTEPTRLFGTKLPDYYSKAFHKLVPEHKLHDCRHTFATRCMECGVSNNVIQRWLGHSSLQTTTQIYQHVQTSFEVVEAAKFSLLSKIN